LKEEKMPSDSTYDRIWEHENDSRNELMRKRREYCKDKFSKMSMEEKIDFLLEEYTEKYAKKDLL
jgi:hypothetical protein